MSYLIVDLDKTPGEMARFAKELAERFDTAA
jgi:hypothetical protein